MTVLRDLLNERINPNDAWVFIHMLKIRERHPSEKGWYTVCTEKLLELIGAKNRKTADRAIERLIKKKYIKKKLHKEHGPNKLPVRGGVSRLIKFNPKYVNEVKGSEFL